MSSIFMKKTGSIFMLALSIMGIGLSITGCMPGEGVQKESAQSVPPLVTASKVSTGSTAEKEPAATGQVFMVTSTGSIGEGSFADAVRQANNLSVGAGRAIINFNIPTTDTGFDSKTGVWTIHVDAPLVIKRPFTIIDGATQADFAGQTNPSGPEIMIIPGKPGVEHPLAIVSANNTVRGLAIGGFKYGLVLYQAGAVSNTIADCFIGVAPDGSSAIPNETGVIIIEGASSNLLENNIISGNKSLGVYLAGKGTGNILRGNRVGTDADGQLRVPNETGVLIIEGASSNLLENNVISGNKSMGIYIAGKGTGNILGGNRIGTDADGQRRVPNDIGLLIDDAAKQQIGEPGSGNIISGNDNVGMVVIGRSASGNTIQGNLIGVDATGKSELHNNIGIVVKALAHDNLIGSDKADGRNIISGNVQIGIYIEAADNNYIMGNYIGTDITGNAIPSGTVVQGNGIEFNTVSWGNVLGGTSPGQRNIISGHTVYGVVYYGHCSNNSTIGNYIGVDATGSRSLPNSTGICVDCASNHNDIAFNVISGNLTYGLFYVTRGTEFNTLRGNFIGTDPTGHTAIPNDIGLVIATGATDNKVGSDDPKDRNIISGNRQAGVMITNRYTQRNEVVGNYIGVDSSGAAALPNLHGMVISTYPKDNLVRANVISGNLQSGIVIYEYAEANQIIGNSIGVAAGGKALGNGGVGIVLDERSEKLNPLGSSDQQNTILNNAQGQTYVQSVPGRGHATAATIPTEAELDPIPAVWVKDRGPVLTGTPAPRPQANLQPSARLTLTVTQTGDTGPGSLRDAITRANLAGGSVAIMFEIPRSDAGFNAANGFWTIAPTETLPPIVAPNIFIDASSQTSALGDTNPLGPEIFLSGGKHTVEYGLMLFEASGATIRGLAVDGFAYGIQVQGSNARDNIIAGNYIGLLPTGARGNGNYNGIELISSAHDNIIGGEDTSDRNVVSGNLHTGLRISDASGNLLVGNYIGIDPTGQNALPNYDGISCEGRSAENQIGGPRKGQRNVISGNVAYGVDLFGHQVSGNLVYGNYIGTDPIGQKAIPNTYGVLFDDRSHGNIVGGLEPGEANLISGNTAFGAYFYNNGTHANIVRGNLIGTDSTGTRSIANETGVHIDGVTVDNIVDRNLISGNLVAGITVFARGTNRNLITGNLIGTDPSGWRPLGNGEDGIRLAFGPSNNSIGGESALGNIIAFNGGAGVFIESDTSQGNRIFGNLIFANAVGGIDLAPPGLNTNDAGDSDAGANALMNSPVIAEVSLDKGLMRVHGTLDTPQADLAIVELVLGYAEPGGQVQGKLPRGIAIPDAQGRWSIELSGITGPVKALAATATDSKGNTSEFGGWTAGK
ncbi:MAG: right-handed parallel beta-helix repeat-containing protein [Chloroflexi bacterium]|nr:right-handed parallel beta-helix repeat-containing protein [Chloroflexota bacterium]